MASGRFTDVPARPTAFLDFRSVTLGESAEFPTRVKGVVAMFEGEVSEGLTEREVPLLSTDEIMILGDEETLCFRSGMRRFRSRRVDIRRFPVLNQRQKIPPPPLPEHSQVRSRALTTVWEERYRRN